MKGRGAPRALWPLGALLVLYLGYPLAAFGLRVVAGHDEGWSAPGLWSALLVSLEGATIALAIGVLTGIPLAYLLARRRGWLASLIGAVVQLPLAVPPLITGVLLVYIVGPYTFLGQLSGERLTQTMYGVVIAQSFVSIPFLVVVARSAFRAADPALSDVAATLGHGPFARFLRVDVPAAGDGLRAGMILLWLRAFGEYGTVVVLAYHPYTLPVYVENLFSSAPLSQAEAPTMLAIAVAGVAILASHLRRPRPHRSGRLPVAVGPVEARPAQIGFDIAVNAGGFELQVAHQSQSHRLAIVGPSGAGKSVALRALAGLLGPNVGNVAYGGENVAHTAPEHRRLGYVPQGFGLLPGRTVWQQVTFGVDANPARATWWLQTLHLDELLERLPEQLSGGQSQRVSLARALAGDPRLVLLDEPFSALDAPVRAELRRELRRLQHNVNLSTVIVTHDPQEAAMLADEIIVIDAGRVLQSGPCASVYRRPVSTQVGRLLGIENLMTGTVGDDGVLITSAGPVGFRTGLGADAELLWHALPEGLHVTAPDAAERPPNAVDIGIGVIDDIIDLGRLIELTVTIGPELTLRARGPAEPALELGASCRVSVDIDALDAWPVAGGERHHPEAGAGVRREIDRDLPM